MKHLKLWSKFFYEFVSEDFQQNHHSLQMASRPLPCSQCTFLFPRLVEHSTSLSYLSFTHCILAVNRRYVPRISQVAALSIAEHRTHCEETRTNTRWPIVWWFTGQWIMWRDLACASFLPLLHRLLPQMNGGYFPSGPLRYITGIADCPSNPGMLTQPRAPRTLEGLYCTQHCQHPGMVTQPRAPPMLEGL
jgi:hypothetical protein